MLTAIGQYVGGKVVTAVLVVSGAGAVIWFWKHPEQLELIWRTLKYVVAWVGIVLILPWATFFATPWVVSQESNAVTAVMLLGYVLVDAIVAFFLMGGILGHDMLTWCVLLLGFLSAGVYNFKVCEYQASRFEDV